MGSENTKFIGRLPALQQNRKKLSWEGWQKKHTYMADGKMPVVFMSTFWSWEEVRKIK
jgi:hypothetical protein